MSLINTINSIMGVDPATLAMSPSTGGKGSHGGYCGPAVKPIALHMVAEIARAPETAGMPISGIGGIATWRDAPEYIAFGAGNVQVCTAAMAYGFKIVQEMIDGLSKYMDAKGFRTIEDFRGRALATITDWQYLNLNYDQQGGDRPDASASSAAAATSPARTPRIRRSRRAEDGKRHYEVKDEECVGCNLCVTVCPVDECITLRTLAPGEIDARTGLRVAAEAADWTTHPNNPMRRRAVPA